MRTKVGLPRTLLGLLVVAALAPGCSNEDPVNPGVPANRFWSEITLPSSLPSVTLFGVAFQADRAIAVGTTSASNGVVLESGRTGWTQTLLPELEGSLVLSIAMDASAHAVVVGFTPPSSALVMSERPNWSTVFSGSPPSAALRAVAVNETGTFVTTGSRVSQLAAWTGTATGEWAEVSIASSGDPQEKALVGVAYGAGVWAACGFDDGGQGSLAQPNSILMIDDGAGWNLIDAPCGGCSNQEYMAVAVSSSGTVYLGGAVTNFGGGTADAYSAFLRSYDRDIEEWTEIALPDAALLDRVNDILLSAEGDIYLACGVDNDSAFLVRLPADGNAADPSNIEWRETETTFRGLGQAADGAVHAVGSQIVNGVMAPFMLRRDLGY